MAQLKRDCLGVAENMNSVSGFKQDPLRTGAFWCGHKLKRFYTESRHLRQKYTPHTTDDTRLQ